MTYPDPEFPIGHVVHNRLDEPLTVVAHERTDRILTGDRRLFSDEDAKRTPWFYTLRDTQGQERNITGGGLHDMQRQAKARSAPAPKGRSRCSPTQPGRMLRVGERLRSPHGTWTVDRARRPHEKSEQGMGEQYCTYLLTHEDGHQEEWRARDMGEADFHLILSDQQTLL